MFQEILYRDFSINETDTRQFSMEDYRWILLVKRLRGAVLKK
jgi:hypothetical protein